VAVAHSIHAARQALQKEAVVMETGEQLRLEVLVRGPPAPAGAPPVEGDFVVSGEPITAEEVERRYARHVLARLGGKRMEAAKALGCRTRRSSSAWARSEPYCHGLTRTGTRLPAVELLPSWPELPLPQHWTPPPATAQVWLWPAAMPWTPEARPETWTGTGLMAVELLPSWPVT